MFFLDIFLLLCYNVKTMEIIEIHSKGEYPANVLSNFYPNDFIFDGVECRSMEGFLQSLKFKNIKKQKNICLLVGKDAKDKGNKKFLWKITGNLFWKGKKYKRESEEFYFLRLRSYRALFENKNFNEALKSTKGKILKHSIGKSNKRKTILTEEEFIDYLDILREEL